MTPTGYHLCIRHEADAWVDEAWESRSTLQRPPGWFVLCSCTVWVPNKEDR